jgi:hypothetical protein
VRAGDTSVQQHGGAGGLVADRLDLVDLVPDGRGAVDLDGARRARDHDLVDVAHRRPGDTGVVLQLGSVDYHHVIGIGDLGQALVQAARRQGDDPERERRPGRQPRVHGGQVGPFQGAAGRVRVDEEHTLPGLGEDVGQPDR